MADVLDGRDPQAIARAATRLRAGGLVAFPTETVYGLGANALDARAVANIYAVKHRPRFDPLIVHVADAVSAADYATGIDGRARRLMERFWPGPLTLVLPKRPVVPDIVTAGLDTVAVRQPAHPVALDLLRAARFPIAAPSANPFGYVSPTTAAHVRDMLGPALDEIIDGGPCSVGVESTVLALDGPRAVLLRPGGVTLEQLESVIGKIDTPSSSGDSARPDPRSPGTLPSHYAPRVPLVLLQPGQAVPRPAQGERVGLLTFAPRADAPGYAVTEHLSVNGDVIEAAANLFAALRRLDAQDLQRVIVEPVPETGLGRAIMDRLRRAAARL